MTPPNPPRSQKSPATDAAPPPPAMRTPPAPAPAADARKPPPDELPSRWRLIADVADFAAGDLEARIVAELEDETGHGIAGASGVVATVLQRAAAAAAETARRHKLEGPGEVEVTSAHERTVGSLAQVTVRARRGHYAAGVGPAPKASPAAAAAAARK